MTLSPDEAASTLGDIEKTSRRSAEIHGYANASPHLIIWGIAWFIGYGGTALYPDKTNLIWPAVAVVGSLASMITGMRTKGGSDASSWRFIATFAALFAFVAATFIIMQPVNALQAGAFIPIFIALIYVVFGIWGGARFTVAGIALAALTLGAFFLIPQYFALWMAFVCSGALILAGLWLRTP